MIGTSDHGIRHYIGVSSIERMSSKYTFVAAVQNKENNFLWRNIGGILLGKYALILKLTILRHVIPSQDPHFMGPEGRDGLSDIDFFRERLIN